MNTYDLSGLNIVLAEKSTLMRRLVRGVLKDLGVQKVRDVSSAEAAYERFQESIPDVIFTDWSPGLDGLGFIQQTRTDADSPNPYVPIIVVTAYTELQHVIRARDSGVNEYLAKPVSGRGASIPASVRWWTINARSSVAWTSSGPTGGGAGSSTGGMNAGPTRIPEAPTGAR